jgi:hypothetical protein
LHFLSDKIEPRHGRLLIKINEMGPDAPLQRKIGASFEQFDLHQTPACHQQSEDISRVP